ncbi:hypothetical protein KBX50_26170 [Micromonospora sp. C51]|uniref:hypothetical protein n=1 Tax=Micromonospora sp. C51 TaxID=2824879 RepID=UPI001B3962F1|nr:hypothetical protein [Micromonospora sp. C51]MBQ1051933.1 hypothetical protein [Micromonospora sp. C51]
MVFATAALLVIAAPAAQAASHYYANETPSVEWQYRYSGVRPAISGGRAFTEPFSADGGNATVIIETYYDYPGYTTIGYADSTGGDVYLSHSNASNSKQKCVWQWPWADPDISGTLDLTCYATS